MEETFILKKGEVLEKVAITEAVSEGKCIARVNSFVIFIQGGIPGDVADIRIDKVKSSYAEGSVVKILTASPQRVTPFCEHFGNCGGCSWQHMTYETQLAFKQKQVEDA